MWNRVTDETYPLGLWNTGDWAAARLATQVAQILIEEKLGYKTVVKGTGAFAQDSFYALMGCRSPKDATNRGCNAVSSTHVHVNVEAWRLFYAEAWDLVQAQYPLMAPTNLGSMGYVGFTSHFVPSKVQQKAYEAEGINLDFYRDYNISWNSPAQYFSQPGDLNVSNLKPCAETALMVHDQMSQYVRWSGDVAGVTTDASGKMVGKCFDGYFWYAPACRVDPSTCFTWFTGGNGWGTNEIMIKAAVFSMPLAIAVASDGANWAAVPTEHDMMLYWWVPDPTFLRLAPQSIAFPANDPDQWAQGDRRTVGSGVTVEKLVSHDLLTLAPDVEEMLRRFTISLKNMDAIMLDQLDTSGTDFEVACRWLQDNADIWEEWIPEQGKCFAQFGMYNEKTDKFLAAREDVVIGCRACPSGTYSAQLTDAKGITFICQECASGYYQPSGASTSCTPCPPGSYQNETGSIACNRCPLGSHQNAEGSRGCNQCPDGSTTRLLGSASASDCGCEEGSINVASSGEVLQCIPCGEGLDCPFGSSLETLQSGQSGGEAVPKILAGFYATIKKPLEILRCKPAEWCPGGTPGTCAGGLLGEPCSACPQGQTWQSGACEDCAASTILLVGALLLALLAFRSAYFLANFEVRAQGTPFKTSAMGSGLVVNAMQLMAMFGLMSVQWPGSVSRTSSSLQFLLLDIEALRLNCVIGSTSTSNYLATTTFFPGVLLWLAFCYALSRLSFYQKWLKEWKWAFTVNTMGLSLQLGFSTIAAISFKPFMCYQHPNGSQSLSNYPSIFCSDSDHLIMLSGGLVLLVLFVLGFLGVCVFACWKLPAWSTKGHYHKVQSFRFCTSNFRFDAYWWINAQLLRSLGLGLTVALGTNLPPAQTGLASVILITYVTFQATTRPWKSPIINFTDTFLNACLLLLLSKAIQTDVAMEQEFSDYYTLIILLCMLCFCSVVGLVCIFALYLQLIGRDWNRLLSLGRNVDPQEASEVLQSCSNTLLKINAPELAQIIAGLNCYDVIAVTNFIGMVGEWSDMYKIDKGVQINSLNSQNSASKYGRGRVTFKSFNKRLSMESALSSGVGTEQMEGENEMLPEASDEESLGEAHLAEVEAETFPIHSNEEANSPKVKTAL